MCGSDEETSRVFGSEGTLEDKAGESAADESVVEAESCGTKTISGMNVA